LSDLLKLQVHDYDYIHDPNHQRMTGFVAQELYEVFPDAVHTNGDDGNTPLAKHVAPWGIDYGRLTPLIVKSVQGLYYDFMDQLALIQNTKMDKYDDA